MKDDAISLCGLCGKMYRGLGNNAWPLAPDPDTRRCCDDCDAKYVTPARIARVTWGSPFAEELLKQIRAMHPNR